MSCVQPTLQQQASIFEMDGKSVLERVCLSLAFLMGLVLSIWGLAVFTQPSTDSEPLAEPVMAARPAPDRDVHWLPSPGGIVQQMLPDNAALQQIVSNLKAHVLELEKEMEDYTEVRELPEVKEYLAAKRKWQ